LGSASGIGKTRSQRALDLDHGLARRPGELPRARRRRETTAVAHEERVAEVSAQST
jgi:hypothetical protein